MTVRRLFGLDWGSALAIGLVATLYRAAITPPPARPIEPDINTQTVRVSHRHQLVVACLHITEPPGCVAQLRDSDTATTVSFVKDFKPAALHHGGASLRLTLPHLPTSQEQVASLEVGQWLVDWRGAPRVEELDVRPDKRLEVALATVSGACVEAGDRCELVSGVRERNVHVTESQGHGSGVADHRRRNIPTRAVRNPR